ncbi:MAG: hypothetical protein HC802_20585 [Caldilineaceae bacterium]|nr:hypothetical protein [Caldilineaceae bacterium]
MQNVNVHEGINNTLLILQNKLKSGVNVRREYDPALPEIEAYGSELNQVWTNIIDNAIDAVEGKGEITIRTRRVDDCWIVVEIEDNGPGIPEEIRHRIFDSFFTTKPPGKGTGLGLDISYRIVVFKHQGDIKVHSRPGMTRFQVWLPSSFEKAKGSPLPMGAYEAPNDAEIKQILTQSKTIAVVGISTDASKPGHTVPVYLQEAGYRIIPVNPNIDQVLGEVAYDELSQVEEAIDIVLIFRRGEAVPDIVDQAVEIGAKTVWMQDGVVNERAAETAKSCGLHVVMDSCIRVRHLMMIQELDAA